MRAVICARQRYAYIRVSVVLKSQARNWDLKSGRLGLTCAHRVRVSLDLNQFETLFVRILRMNRIANKIQRARQSHWNVPFSRLYFALAHSYAESFLRNDLDGPSGIIAARSLFSYRLFENWHRNELLDVLSRFLCNCIAKIEQNLPGGGKKMEHPAFQITRFLYFRHLQSLPPRTSF